MQDPAADRRTLAPQFLLFLVAGTQFMQNLDGTIIATALPTMAKTFGRAAVDLNIGMSVYMLALGIFIPASGWVTDRFGARRTFTLAIALFTLASALCGTSRSLAAFVMFRILQGLAGAMMVPVGRLVILRETPRERLMEAMATLVWPALIAPVLGPPLGGLITTHASWRWIFYLNVPLGLVALALAWFLVPDLRADERRSFDGIGFVLCGVGICMALYGFERFVADPHIWSLIASLVGVALLWQAVHHFRRARHPMLDLGAYRYQTFRMALRGGSLTRMAVGSAPFLLPLMFQVGFGYSPQVSGFLMLGIFGANLGLKTVTNRIIRSYGFRPVLLWNGLLCVVTLAACALLEAETPLWLMLLILLVGGAARSMQFTAITMITFADVPKAEMTGANGFSSTVGQLTMGMGIALGASSIRVGSLLSQYRGNLSPAAPYHVAFVIVAAVAFLALADAFRLPPGAGDHFAQKT